ncbi:MAG: hypothetical protein DRN15_08220 [Thermoprotei archaeon]|nr:MAG: hypothetical protein DRN15_08220 [Thermoprotei archaeon]RLF24831.1 MAG: hypothetical protein DRM97_02900 [Thermoprotei archaeon]
MNSFTFYVTFHPKACPPEQPITIGFERVTTSLLNSIKGYRRVFMHSGNWWRLSERIRTPSRILSSLRKLSEVCNVEGFMSINIPPKVDIQNYDIWNLPKEIRERALKRSLEYADILLQSSPKTTLYCSYEVGTLEDSMKWYRIALEHGHVAFGAGFAGFLMGRIRVEAYKRMIEVIVGARSVIGDKPFHASGVASLKLLPIICYAGATSADGSTPVRVALAMGQVYDITGKAHGVLRLERWNCTCRMCSEYGREIIKLLKDDYNLRVRHNIEVWNENLAVMNEALREGRLEEYITRRIGRSPLLRKTFEYARELRRRLLRR